MQKLSRLPFLAILALGLGACKPAEEQMPAETQTMEAPTTEMPADTTAPAETPAAPAEGQQ